MEFYPCKTCRGIFGVALTNGKISNIVFPEKFQDDDTIEKSFDIIDRLASDLDQLFAGKPVDWSAYLLDTGIATKFQAKVWQTLQTIPHGETRSYSQIANSAGSRAVRAVGTACACNPIPILIPCHRVVRMNGILGNYAGGVEWKKFLLACEGNHQY